MNAARIRALVVVGTLMVGALTLVFVTVHRDTQTHADYLAGCPARSVIVVTSPLPNRNEVTVKVWNASSRPGLAETVAEQLRHRGYQVQKVGPKDNKPTIEGVAAIYYGPRTVGGAWVVRAELLMTDIGQMDAMHFNIKSTSTVVDLVLGRDFRQLGAITEVNQALAALGTPDAPPGTCAQRG